MTMDSKEDCRCFECGKNDDNEISLYGDKGGCNDDLMIADTGASVHIRKKTQNLFGDGRRSLHEATRRN
jgi:hypothetical protein